VTWNGPPRAKTHRDKQLNSAGAGPGTIAPMSRPVRALRGATTVDDDTAAQVDERVAELLREMLDRNGAGHDDLVSVIFTTTPDIRSRFPATAARGLGLGDVPLLGAQEQDVAGAPPRVIRVMIHLETSRDRSELHHIYLHGAQTLRDDLAP